MGQPWPANFRKLSLGYPKKILVDIQYSIILESLKKISVIQFVICVVSMANLSWHAMQAILCEQTLTTNALNHIARPFPLNSI